jgi:hypothetical protein
MKMEIRRLVAAAAVAAPLSLFASLANSQTINFGANLPAGPVPAGYAGFNWGTGANAAINSGADADVYYLTAPAASIVEFSRANLFDLNSVDYQILMSGITYETTFNNYTTVISGYRGTTLVKSVTENYPGAGSDLFAGLNIDGVNRITFSTTDTFGYLDSGGNPVVVGVERTHSFAGVLGGFARAALRHLNLQRQRMCWRTDRPACPSPTNATQWLRFSA